MIGKTRKILYLLVLIIFNNCSSDNFASNDFDGGKYYLEIVCCEEEIALKEFEIERDAKSITIWVLGRCKMDDHRLVTKSAAQIGNDSIYLSIQVDQ